MLSLFSFLSHRRFRLTITPCPRSPNLAWSWELPLNYFIWSTLLIISFNFYVKCLLHLFKPLPANQELTKNIILPSYHILASTFIYALSIFHQSWRMMSPFSHCRPLLPLFLVSHPFSSFLGTFCISFLLNTF